MILTFYDILGGHHLGNFEMFVGHSDLLADFFCFPLAVLKCQACRMQEICGDAYCIASVKLSFCHLKTHLYLSSTLMNVEEVCNLDTFQQSESTQETGQFEDSCVSISYGSSYVNYYWDMTFVGMTASRLIVITTAAQDLILANPPYVPSMGSALGIACILSSSLSTKSGHFPSLLRFFSTFFTFFMTACELKPS